MSDAGPPPVRLPWGFVGALSLAQLVSWGAVFYAFTLFMAPMTRELGWSKPELTAAFSLGLLASALGAVPVGRLIDLGYGRMVMTGGSLAAALFLALWSRVESYPAFIAIWIGLGATMSAVLYDPAFAILTHRLGPLARRGITAMTLVGGFASTAFVPLTHLLIEGLGWRGALLALALANLACAAIHALVIPPRAGRSRGAVAAAPVPSEARRVLRQVPFWGLVAVSVLHNGLFTGFAVHFVPLLVERGFSLDAAVAAFAVVGPAQVGARVVFAVGERRLSMRAVGLLTTAVPVLAFALLPLVPAGSWLVVAFGLLYGAANGLMTIVRALLPPEIFGREDYGAIQGMIALPTTVAKAAGPFAFGLLWAWSGGYGAVIATGIAMALASFAAFLVAVFPATRPTRPN